MIGRHLWAVGLGLLAAVGPPARAMDEPAPGNSASTTLTARVRATLEQIQSLDLRRADTEGKRARAVAERDAAQRVLDQARSTHREFVASEARSRSAVGGGLSALRRLRGHDALSGILDDADRARSARMWRNLGLLVRYATGTMQVHAVRLANQSSLVWTLEERAADLRARERMVSSVERDLQLEREAKRELLAGLLNERERALEASSLTVRSIDGLTAPGVPRAGDAPRSSSMRSPQRPKPRFSGWKGRLKAPVEGRIVSRFGEDRDQRGQTVVRSNGVRFATEPDARVRATLDGRVVHRGYVPGLGNVVILEHGEDYFTVYGHLGEVRAVAGSDVARGDTIATAGSTGLAEEPSVYFEIRHGGEALDPCRWLEPEQVITRRAKGSRGRT